MRLPFNNRAKKDLERVATDVGAPRIARSRDPHVPIAKRVRACVRTYNTCALNRNNKTEHSSTTPIAHCPDR